jgi:hypothetical protein
MDHSNDFLMSMSPTPYKIHRSLSSNDVSINHPRQGLSDSEFTFNSSVNIPTIDEDPHTLAKFFSPNLEKNKRGLSLTTSPTSLNAPHSQCNTGINNMENNSLLLETTSQKNPLFIPILKKKYSLTKDYETESKKYYENRKRNFLSSNSFNFTEALINQKRSVEPFMIDKTKKEDDYTTLWNFSVTSPSSHNLLHSVISDRRLEQVKKHITFTANVVTEAVHASHLCGVANAPTVSMGSQLNTNGYEGNQLIPFNEANRRSLSRNVQEKIQKMFSIWSDKGETRWTPLETKPPQHAFSTTDVEHFSSVQSNFNKETNKIYTSKYPSKEKPLCATPAIHDSKDQKSSRFLSVMFQKYKRKNLVKKHIYQKSKSNSRYVSNVKLVIPLPYDKPKKRFFNFITRGIPMTIKPLVCGFKKKKKKALGFKALNPTITLLNELVLMTFNVGLLEYCFGGISWYRNPPFTKFRLQHIARKLTRMWCIHILRLYSSIYLNH